jgi:thiamine transporter ThiT
MTQTNTRKMILAALFMALGFILPFFTGQIPAIGNKLLPMHLPILLCGFICGWQYGLAIGFITPLLRSLLLGMPPLFPIATAMAFELATYGLLAGLLYQMLNKKPLNIYITLILSMIGGRIVWGIVSAILFGIAGTPFSAQIFIGAALINAVPGIIIQLILVPIIIMAFNKEHTTQHA